MITEGPRCFAPIPKGPKFNRPGVCNRYAYLPEKHRALEAWASKLEGIINPAVDNVVPIG